MSPYDPAATYSVFLNLLKDLDGFIDTSQLEMVCDSKQQAFLRGSAFREQLTANPTSQPEIREQMRQILARYLGRNSQQG